jgi:hypothetical protein
MSVAMIAISVLGISYLSKTQWWENHICADFSKSGHHDICFDCNEAENGNCYTHKCPIKIQNIK